MRSLAQLAGDENTQTAVFAELVDEHLESASESARASQEGGDMSYANLGVGHKGARVPDAAQIEWVAQLVA
jgi:hypothetical protein